MNNDLISREALIEAFAEECCGCCDICSHCMTGYRCELIDNAPTVELTETEIQEVLNKRCMTAVANEYLIALHGRHTIDYTMGWKACIEWIKKGGAE